MQLRLIVQTCLHCKNMSLKLLPGTVLHLNVKESWIELILVSKSLMGPCSFWAEGGAQRSPWTTHSISMRISNTSFKPCLKVTQLLCPKKNYVCIYVLAHPKTTRRLKILAKVASKTYKLQQLANWRIKLENIYLVISNNMLMLQTGKSCYFPDNLPTG